jgi:hypothetical protein
MKMAFLKNSFPRKTIASLIIICLIGVITGPILFYPKTAKAADAVVVVASGPQSKGNFISWLKRISDKIFQAGNLGQLIVAVAEKVWDNAQKLAEWASGTILNLLLHQILAQLTNDIVNWIQGGGEPRFMSEGFGGFLSRAVDNAVGNFVDNYLGMGWLCEPFDVDIKIALLDVPTFEEKARCTLSDIVDNIENFAEDFSQGGWRAWIELGKPQNNFYGAVLLAQQEKDRVASETQREVETEAQMGGGFLSARDCVWRDQAGKIIQRQKNVRGIPPLPEACKGSDPSVVRPCALQCETLTPAVTIQNTANKAISNYFDKINAQIAGATAKTGPFQIYVQTIINALINRVITEGVGLLKASPETTPSYGQTGASASLPRLANPQSVAQERAQIKPLSEQLGLMKQNLETQLLKEQKSNLSLLKSISSNYSETLLILEDIIINCKGTEYDQYVSWGKSQKNNINDNLLPPIDREINQLETIEIPKTVAAVSDVNVALTSLQDYDNKARSWIEIYEETGGRQDDPALKEAKTTMDSARNKAVQDVQTIIKAINGTTLSTDLSGLTQEAQNANFNIVSEALNLEQKRGDPTWPEQGSLYAQLESSQSLKDETENRLDDCPVPIEEEEEKE